jgi:hypothetical protein
MLESMFEEGSSVSSPEVIAYFDELMERCYPSKTAESAAFLGRIGAMGRIENRAAAAQLVAVGELFGYRLSRCSDTERWAVDTEAAVAAEVAAVLCISQGLAASRLRYARAMRERLPRVGAVFAAGDIGFLLFATMVYRTDLITDAAVLAAVDAQLAVAVPRWPSMTRGRLAGAVDKIVARADADAVRRRRQHQADRYVCIEDFVEGGVSEIQGRLFAVDAHVLEKRLAALAATVCEYDSRSFEQRRADALGALAAGADRLGCRCGRPDCAAGARRPAGPVVIHVLAEQATVEAAGAVPGSEVGADVLVPAELVAELAASARLVALAHPGEAPPEAGYVASKALADFIRFRDLTCRWPGCDRPAPECDIDHTIPYADGGPTHASNLKCYCRTHHLVKTFWNWKEKQLADGTLILIAPSGQTCVTTPGSALLFPSLCRPVGGIPDAEADPPAEQGPDRAAMMPRRARTRAANRAQRVAAERRQNHHARTAAGPARRSSILGYLGTDPPDINDNDPPPF